jgi:hypothetical protein
MAQGDKPWGYAQAVVPGGNEKDEWVELGPVWRTEKGNLTFTLRTEPLAWRDIRTPRRIVITQASEPKSEPQGRGRK